MGRITNTGRRVLARLPLFLWGGAVSLVVLLLASDGWDPATTRGLLGAIVLLACGAMAASVCRSIERTHAGSLRLLLDALLDQQPRSEPAEHHFREVA